MKRAKRYSYPQDLTKFGCSKMFQYATSRANKEHELNTNRLKTWDKLAERELYDMAHSFPWNGFQEMIQLTEDGKLWPYPIDNELGLDEEKKVPFEDHIFLDQHLKGFSDDERIQSFMQLVIMGLSKNPYITVERKVRVIDFYKNYFDSKRELYKQSGVDV